MKRINFLLVCLCLGLTPITGVIADEENLLDNPGFEEDLSYWTDIYGVGGIVSESIYHAGSQSAYTYVETTTDREYWTQIYQDKELSAGESIYGSIYIKTDFSPEAGAKANLMLQFLDSSDNVLGSSVDGRTVGGSTDWRLVEVSSSSAPSGTTNVRLSANLWAAQGDDISLTGNAYFDDASLIKKYQEISLPAGLLNTGFENGLHDWSNLWGPLATLNKDAKYSGSYCAEKKINTVSGQDYWSQIYQDISCSSSKKVTAKMYIKTDFASNAKAKAGLQIECFDSSGKRLTKASVSTAVKSWKQFACKIAKTPANTVKVRLSGYLYAPQGNTASLDGKAYFDNASLEIK